MCASDKNPKKLQKCQNIEHRLAEDVSNGNHAALHKPANRSRIDAVDRMNFFSG
jgi:hypothetical protein